MASLTYTAYMSRNIIKYGGIGLAVFTVLWMMGTAAIEAYNKAHPPYVAPTVRYGLLPKIVFPDKQAAKKNFNLELPNDAFPAFKDQARVYFIPRPDNNFLALEIDRKIAQSIGFVNEPTQIKEGVYEFRNDSLNQVLTMNVLENSFKMKYPYETDQMLQNPQNVPAKDQAILTAQDFLSRAGKMNDDLTNGTQKVSYFKIEYNGLKPATAQADADVARVDFFRQPLEGNYLIVSDTVDEAPISILVTGSFSENRRVLEVNYKYASIDREAFSTYPIKTPQTAWNEMQQGNYWTASDSNTPTVTIRKVSLAYFEPVTLTNFLQPIYVFEGDNNFVAYVPAVTDKYVQSK